MKKYINLAALLRNKEGDEICRLSQFKRTDPLHEAIEHLSKEGYRVVKLEVKSLDSCHG